MKNNELESFLISELKPLAEQPRDQSIVNDVLHRLPARPSAPAPLHATARDRWVVRCAVLCGALVSLPSGFALGGLLDLSGLWAGLNGLNLEATVASWLAGSVPTSLANSTVLLSLICLIPITWVFLED